jgi:predicted kinase
MSTLYVTRGLPGSGKSYWAKVWVAEAPARRARVNRDCLRDMLAPGCHRPDTEAAVSAAATAAAKALLAEGWSVVSDDTNLRRERMVAWAWVAFETGATLHVVDLTSVPVAVCVERDAGRPDRGYPPERWDGARVGAKVIEEMAGRYLTADGMVTA